MKTTIKTANSVASIVAAAVILGWAATASTAHAADAPQPWLNKTVTYGDLNLETKRAPGFFLPGSNSPPRTYAPALKDRPTRPSGAIGCAAMTVRWPQRSNRSTMARSTRFICMLCTRHRAESFPWANENAAGGFVGGVSVDCVGAVPSISAARLIHNEIGCGL